MTARATDLLGRPHAPRGRGPRAYDCWGLVREVYRLERGVVLPEYLDGYSGTSIADAPTIASRIREERGSEWIEVPLDEVSELDVVLFNIAGQPAHCGVAMRWPMFMHARQGVGVCVESAKASRWRNRVEGAWRYAV